VIRDHDGRAVSASSGSLAAVHDADCAEAQACVAALHMASNQGILRIILESDSMTTVKAL
jgi:ribonuclease HI